MIPNKCKGVSFDRNLWIFKFSGKSLTAGHLVIPGYLKTLAGSQASHLFKRQNVEIKPYCCQ